MLFKISPFMQVFYTTISEQQGGMLRWHKMILTQYSNSGFLVNKEQIISATDAKRETKKKRTKGQLRIRLNESLNGNALIKQNSRLILMMPFRIYAIRA